MGIVIFQEHQGYLIDDDWGSVYVLPCQLFAVSDGTLHPGWRFKLLDNSDESYPYIQAILSYESKIKVRDWYEGIVVDGNSDLIDEYYEVKSRMTRTVEDEDLH